MSANGSQILTAGRAVPQFHQRGTEQRYNFRKRKRESQTQANVFSYNKLTRGRREIRLCILDPGAIEDPLTCALRTVSLKQHPVYETLSYAWGDLALNNEIVANGGVIKITRNLHTALRYLRKTDGPRVIWADGVCINQSDLDERSSQVGMMGDIYQEGKGLQIWLGEAEEIESEFGRSTTLCDSWQFEPEHAEFFTQFLQSQNLMKTLPPIASMGNPSIQPNIPSAIRILELLATGCHLYQTPFFKVTGPKTIEPCTTWATSLRVLSMILSRPWWSRVWIVQEVLLSIQATVHIGEYKVPLPTIFDAIASLQKHTDDCCRLWRLLWYGHYNIAVSIIESRTRIWILGVIKDPRARETTLNQALYISTSREASDPRDHFYGLQGLLKKDLTISKPSYQISTQNVYSSATKMLYFEDTGLEMLSHAVGIESSNAHALASWVCDWSREGDPTVIRPYMFNASNGSKFRTEQISDGILTVEACKVDVVCTTGITIGQFRRLGTRLECLEAWWSLAEIEDSNEKPAIWTTILGGCLHAGSAGQYRRILPEDVVAVEAWRKLATSLVEQGYNGIRIPHGDRKMRLIDEDISYSMSRSKLWSTSQGFLGLGRQTVEKGDEVFIIKGSPVPLILRPIEGARLSQLGLPEREQGYLFVGECYLHGFMDGEAVKSDTKWQRVHLC